VDEGDLFNRAILNRHRVLTQSLIVFDTTVPFYFSRVGQVPLLEGLFRGRALIPSAVFAEIEGLSYDHPGAALLLKSTVFKTIRPTQDEEEEALDYQRSWRGLDAVLADPKKNRGEAHCVALSRRSTPPMPIVLHDHEAFDNLRSLKIPRLHMVDIAVALTTRGGYTPDAAWQLYESMVRLGMHQIDGYDLSDHGSRGRFNRACDALKLARPGVSVTHREGAFDQ